MKLLCPRAFLIRPCLCVGISLWDSCVRVRGLSAATVVSPRRKEVEALTGQPGVRSSPGAAHPLVRRWMSRRRSESTNDPPRRNAVA
jgi:hypothetical protein